MAIGIRDQNLLSSRIVSVGRTIGERITAAGKLPGQVVGIRGLIAQRIREVGRLADGIVAINGGCLVARPESRRDVTQASDQIVGIGRNVSCLIDTLR